MSTPSDHDPYLALRFGDYRLLLTGSLISSLGGQMLALAIGWELYERTSSALALGIIGGVQILPVLALALIAGHVADRYHRKTVVMVSQLVLAATSLGLAAMSYWQGPLVAIYGFLLLRGIGAAFSGPAANALPAEVLPEHVFENASSWRSTFGQVAAIAGPALAGLIIAAVRTATFVFVLAALASVIYVALLAFVRDRAMDHPIQTPRERPTLRSLGEGVVFLRRTPVILAAITLDLFAVLFGGATALMPIFAKDILQVGPSGLGWLQAAPSIGAAAVALYLAHRPPMQRAGRTLLLVVAGFGLATIFFGLSRSFALSLAMLATLGGLDAVSMVVRDTLVLARTPHDMRGRVAAIEGVFVSSSNQLGGFESGVTAQLFGPVVSVVGGGIGTILVVVLTALLSPELRGLRTLRASEPGAGIVSATSSPARQ